MKERVLVYSEAFKRQVVTNIETGRFSSIAKASRAYGIKGKTTIRNWIIKYGREDILPKKIRIETLKEINELKQMRKRNRDLEAALADSYIDLCLEDSFLKIACKRLGMTVEEFKKKNATTLSEVLKKSRED